MQSNNRNNDLRERMQQTSIYASIAYNMRNLSQQIFGKTNEFLGRINEPSFHSHRRDVLNDVIFTHRTIAKVLSELDYLVKYLRNHSASRDHMIPHVMSDKEEIDRLNRVNAIRYYDNTNLVKENKSLTKTNELLVKENKSLSEENANLRKRLAQSFHSKRSENFARSKLPYKKQR